MSIEEGQTTQCPKEKGQKGKQRSKKHTQNTNYRATRTPLRIEDEIKCSGKVWSSCSTIGARRVNIVTKPVMNEERTGKCLRQLEPIRGHL